MTNVYDQHSAAFSKVAAFLVFKDHERVATVAIKYPARGGGRFSAYLHVIGLPMVRGRAGGDGYDKASAAVASAARLVRTRDYYHDISEHTKNCDTAKFWNELAPSLDSGREWTRALERVGFTVHQAV
jgi:hypothetical protein